MIPFKIGNWEITNQGIKWIGKGGRELLIDVDRINENGFGERENTYDWLIHLTEKNWLTRDDIYALNSAFIYTISYFDLTFKPDFFVKTLILQEKELKFMEESAD